MHLIILVVVVYRIVVGVNQMLEFLHCSWYASVLRIDKLSDILKDYGQSLTLLISVFTLVIYF